MHIQQKDGHTIRLLKTVYDPTKRRGTNVYLGTVSIWSSRIPEKVLSKLSEDEKAKLATKISEMKGAFEARVLQSTVRSLASDVETVASGIDNDHRLLGELQLQPLKKAVRRLWRVIRRAQKADKGSATK